jgi:hypothetical protein
MRTQRNWNRQLQTLETLASDNEVYKTVGFETEEWSSGHVHVKRRQKFVFDDGRLGSATHHESFVVGKRGSVKPLYQYTSFL